MSLTANNWKNKRGTSQRTCSCGSWAKHWLNFSKEKWPAKCSVSGCNNYPTLGAHIYNPNEIGEWIVPMCDACNQKSGSFDLKGYVTCVPANTTFTCGK